MCFEAFILIDFSFIYIVILERSDEEAILKNRSADCKSLYLYHTTNKNIPVDVLTSILHSHAVPLETRIVILGGYDAVFFL
jgi:hypothetical protein